MMPTVARSVTRKSTAFRMLSSLNSACGRARQRRAYLRDDPGAVLIPIAALDGAYEKSIPMFGPASRKQVRTGQWED